MNTIAEKFLYLNDTKVAIKNAIINKGIEVDANLPFRNYADKIANITSSEPIPTGIEWSYDGWLAEYNKMVDSYPISWLPMPVIPETDEKCHVLVAVYDCGTNFIALSAQGAYTVDWGDGVVEDFASNVTAEHNYSYSNVNLSNTSESEYGYKQAMITIKPQAGNNITTIDFFKKHSSLSASDNAYLQPILGITINLEFLNNLSLSYNTINVVYFALLKYFELKKNQ